MWFQDWGVFYVEFEHSLQHSGYSSFLPHTNIMHVRLTGDCNCPLGVSEWCLFLVY